MCLNARLNYSKVNSDTVIPLASVTNPKTDSITVDFQKNGPIKELEELNNDRRGEGVCGLKSR